MRRKNFIILVTLIIIFNFLKCFGEVIVTTTTSNIPLWNLGSTWASNKIPTVLDDVTITKGFTVIVDTWAICQCNSLTIEENAKLVFSSGTGQPINFLVGLDITLKDGASIVLATDKSSGDSFYITARNIVFDGELSKFILNSASNNTTYYINLTDIKLNTDKSAQFTVNITSKSNITINTRDILLVASPNYKNRFDVEINSPEVKFDINSRKIKIGENGEFNIKVNSGSDNSNVDISFACIEIENGGISRFFCDRYTSVMNLKFSGEISPGYIINNGELYIRGADPNPSNTQKPDPENNVRNFRIIGRYNDCYIQSNSWIEIEHAIITKVGLWRTQDKYGINIINVDGANGCSSKKIYFYNLDISSSADTGIYFENCKRMNEWWYNQGVSSNIIHNCQYNGIWFDKTTKSSIRYNKIYNNVGGNIGYGIHLTDSSNENDIIGNEIYSNKIRGIYIESSNKNLIDSNNVHNQLAEEGISLINSQKNVIIKNECRNNYVHGISLDTNSKNNYIGANKCSNNGNSGIRVRYNSDQNIFVGNISSGNARSGFASHSSKDNLCVDEIYSNNSWGDIYIEGEENEGYISQLWLKNCLLESTTEFVNTPEKQEFTKEGSWVISQKHDKIPGLTRIWGQFSMPQSFHKWHTNDILKWNYQDETYNSKSHGWNTVISQYDTPMLRYDDGGIDGDGGTNDITSVTISTSTSSEVWIVSYGYGETGDKWQVRGTKSGIDNNLLVHDTDYESKGREVKFRITHKQSPISPGEQYIFITISGSNDEETRKEVNFCDFSDKNYIGAKFTNNTGATIEIAGTPQYPTIVTRKLAEDKTYNIIADTYVFYYGLCLGGTINKIQNTYFKFLNNDGLTLNSVPLANTKEIYLYNLQPGTTYASYITANNIKEHTFDNICIDTTNITGVYNVAANNSTLYFRDYIRPYLPDKLNNSVVYWDPTLEWAGDSGFQNDGIEPNLIDRLAGCEFRVKYYDRGITTDLKGNPPTTIQVWIDLNDDLIYETTEQFGMCLKPGVGNDNDYTNGEIYYFIMPSINFAGDGKLNYRFYATNPYSITITTTPFNLYSTSNTIPSINEATGIPTYASSFTVKGIPPQVSVVTPIGKQSGSAVTIAYYLTNNDNFIPCNIKVEFLDGEWKTATRGVGSEPLTNLKPSEGHIFVWDTNKDLPNKDIQTKIRITPSDDDGTGNPAITNSFRVDNIIVQKIGFKDPEQELLTGATSQIITVLAQDSVNNPDYDANLLLYLESTSTDYAFVSSTADIKITQVQMNNGIAQFRYRDEWKGNPVLRVYTDPGLQILDGTQSWFITKPVSVDNSSVSVQGVATVPVGSTVTIIVTLRDTENAVVQNKDVIIIISGSDNTILYNPLLSKTDASGRAYISFYSTKAEQKIINAVDVTDDNKMLKSTATVTFTPDIVSTTKSYFTVVPSTYVNVGTTVTINITLVDKYNNPLPDKTVNIVIPNMSLGDNIIQPVAPTDVNGQTSGSFVSSVSGEKLIQINVVTDNKVLSSTKTVTYWGVIDFTAPTVVFTYPGNGATISNEIMVASATISDTGGSGINLASSTISLYRFINNTNVIVASTRTTNGIDTLILKFDRLINGQYGLHVLPYDNNNNVGNLYISSFVVLAALPYVIETNPPNDALITTAITQVTAKLSQGYFPLDLNSSIIKLYDSNNNEISGTKTNNGVDTLILTFAPLGNNGRYGIHVIPYDTNNNVGTLYISSFNVLIAIEPKEQFIKSSYVYPNPAKSKASFNYIMKENGKIKLQIYNILGELLYEEEKEETAGENKTLTWDGINKSGNKLGSGVYIYKLIATFGNDRYETTKKMIFIK